MVRGTFNEISSWDAVRWYGTLFNSQNGQSTHRRKSRTISRWIMSEIILIHNEIILHFWCAFRYAPQYSNKRMFSPTHGTYSDQVWPLDFEARLRSARDHFRMVTVAALEVKWSWPGCWWWPICMGWRSSTTTKLMGRSSENLLSPPIRRSPRWIEWSRISSLCLCCSDGRQCVRVDRI